MRDPGIERSKAEQPQCERDACLDSEVIAGLREIMPADLMDELIDQFLSAFSDESRALAGAIEKADPRQTCEVAHKLRGSCAALGATYLTALCNTIEQNARAQHLDGAQQLLSEMEDEFQRVRRALDQERSEPTEAAPSPR
jgi:two-component system aerobic respiration control sensor histidine kinase ArcB